MPFTLSHAVVALPFRRSGLPVGAVAIGAMAPDLPLFFPIGIGYFDTHGFPQFLLVSPLIAFVLFAIWRMLLRPASRRLAPRWIGERLPAQWSDARGGALAPLRTPSRDGSSRRGVNDALLVGAGLLIGVLTHVVWDEFTHPGRSGDVLVPALAEEWAGLRGTEWLQHASSALGLLVLAVWAALWLRSRQRVPVESAVSARARWAYWSTLPLALVAGAAVAFARVGAPASVDETKDFLFRSGTYGASAFLVITLVAAVALALRSRRLTSAQAPR